MPPNVRKLAPPPRLSAIERVERQLKLAAQEVPSRINNLGLTLECPEHPIKREPLRLVMKDEPEGSERTNEETGEIWYSTHPHDVRAQFRRKVYSTMREIHAFRQLNPVDADNVGYGSMPFYWQAYAESNDQAKYYSILVGDGYPGSLYIVGGKAFWRPTTSDERFARSQASAPPRVELEFTKYTRIELRFVKDRIVMRVRLGEEYTSNGEKGIDYHDHCLIFWSDPTSIKAIQMISWMHKKAIEASGDAAAKTLAYFEEDEALPVEQLEREYDTASDGAHVGWAKPAYTRFDEPARKLKVKEKIPFNVTKQTDRWGGLGEWGGLGDEECTGPDYFRAQNPWKGGQTPRAFKKFERYFL